MPEPRPDVMDFLQSRRSRPAKTLRAPGPDHAALAPILTAGLRVPDHGKLEPWRLVVFDGAAMDRLADLARARGAALGIVPDKIDKAALLFETAPLMVLVVAAPVESEKVPEVEQILSAGCVCLSLVNAALASGWGANWITGYAAHDAAFAQNLGLSEAETIAGFIFIGTEGAAPPERPRPDIAAKTQYVCI